MSGRLMSPIVVGRTTELGTIADGLDVAVNGGATTLLLAGEAGVGKSRLVGEAIRMANERGVQVLRGACVNIGSTGVPYGPIVEALRELQRELPPGQMAELVGSSGPDVARLLPSLGDGRDLPEPTGQSQWLQARLLEAILGLTQRLAARGPVLFVVEDLHWADPGTRETLTYLVRNLRSDAVALLMTYRSDELHRRHPLLPWLAEVERIGRVIRIDVRRLEPAVTRELLASILGEEPDGDLARRVVERSDGNPFFIEELTMAERTSSGRAMPPTLRDILLARIAALTEAAQAVVGVAAVAGRRVDHDLLAKVAGQDESTTIAALRDAVGQHVLIADHGPGAEGYAFRHALMQEATYDDLLPGERRRLHRAFAEAVAARDAGSGAADRAAHWAELAYHWSSTRDDARALEASVRAGIAAMDAYAFADALRHFETALDLWSSVDEPEAVAGLDLASLLDLASWIASLDGQTRRGASLREAAIAELDQEADPVRAALWHERLGRQRWLAADTTGALHAYDAAMAMAAAPSPARARILSGCGQLLMLLDRWDESRQLCEEALALARSAGDRQVEGHALCTLGPDYAALGSSEKGIAAIEEAHRIAVEIENLDDIGRSTVNLVNTLLYSGQGERATVVTREGIAEAQRLGIASSYGIYIAHEGVQALNDVGRWSEALELSSDTFARQNLEPHLDRYGLARLVPLLVSMGAPEARERLDQLGRLLEGRPSEGQFAMPYLVSRAEFELWDGRPADALQTTQRGLAELDETALVWSGLRLAALAARAAAELAEVSRARHEDASGSVARAGWEALTETLQAATAAGAFAGRDASADTQIQAVLAAIEAEGRRVLGAPAADAWARAVETAIVDGKPYPLAYVHWRLAEALLTDGNRTDATAPLRAAHETAVALGADPLRRAVVGLAARARISLAEADAPIAAVAPAPADPFGLTPREREVLALVSTGRTNRQIADELFISESTAGVHVSNILGKLGVATRTEAAGVAVRLELDRA
ncbi:MAG TPA: AAA family ATPase [Candidatus Limnocylindrales bacterium]|nr:AAA family ATPase [Candidatus Limnocylindrales bacterium]